MNIAAENANTDANPRAAALEKARTHDAELTAARNGSVSLANLRNVIRLELLVELYGTFHRLGLGTAVQRAASVLREEASYTDEFERARTAYRRRAADAFLQVNRAEIALAVENATYAEDRGVLVAALLGQLDI